jgi:peptidoglycan/xylan/chitin deacetylase (PgdA/CDA1 family)
MNLLKGLQRRASRIRKSLFDVPDRFGRGTAPVVLMYHRVAEVETDPWGLAVSPARFDDQLRALASRRLVLPLAEFCRLRRASALPANAVAITFDDGYACNALVAAPLLEKHRLPATVFITTGVVLKGEEFWWDVLERIVQTVDAQALSFTMKGKSETVVLGKKTIAKVESSWRVSDGAMTKRQAAYLELWDRLRLATDDERKPAIANLCSQANDSGLARQSNRALTGPEVRRMASSGLVEIGAHSVTHPLLTRLTHEEVRVEINRSRDDCQMLSGYKPTAFAYPYGDYDEEAISAVAEAGFDVACTTAPAAVGSMSRDLELPRLQVHQWSGMSLLAAMERLAQE